MPRNKLFFAGVKEGIPFSIPGLIMWYAADTIEGLTDGQGVALIKDLSGNGFTRTRGDSAKPIYKVNIINGKPVMRGDGSKAIDSAVSISLSIGTVFAVAGNVSNGASASAIDKIVSPISRIITFYPDNITIFNGADFMGNPSATWIDGVSTYNLGNTGYHVITQRAVTPVSVVNKQLSLLSGNSPLAGDIAEVVYFSRILSNYERSIIEKWLGRKYAISVT